MKCAHPSSPVMRTTVPFGARCRFSETTKMQVGGDMEIPHATMSGLKKAPPPRGGGGGVRKMQSITLISIMDDLRTLCILCGPRPEPVL